MKQAQSFNRQCDDLETWITQVENQLNSEDHGRDVTTVTILLKKQLVSIEGTLNLTDLY